MARWILRQAAPFVLLAVAYVPLLILQAAAQSAYARLVERV